MTDKTLKVLSAKEDRVGMIKDVITPILQEEDNFIFLKRDEDYEGEILIYSSDNLSAIGIIEMLEGQAALMRKEIEEKGFYTWGESRQELEVVEEEN